jgi:hypothetical protein
VQLDLDHVRQLGHFSLDRLHRALANAQLDLDDKRASTLVELKMYVARGALAILKILAIRAKVPGSASASNWKNIDVSAWAIGGAGRRNVTGVDVGER